MDTGTMGPLSFMILTQRSSELRAYRKHPITQIASKRLPGCVLEDDLHLTILLRRRNLRHGPRKTPIIRWICGGVDSLPGNSIIQRVGKLDVVGCYVWTRCPRN